MMAMMNSQDHSQRRLKASMGCLDLCFKSACASLSESTEDTQIWQILMEAAVQHMYLSVSRMQHMYLSASRMQHIYLSVSRMQHMYLCVSWMQHIYLCVSRMQRI
jgi:hypothetical protein